MKNLPEHVGDLLDAIDPEAEGRTLALQSAQAIQMLMLRQAAGEDIGDAVAIELETIADVTFASQITARKVILDAAGRWTTDLFNLAHAWLI